MSGDRLSGSGFAGLNVLRIINEPTAAVLAYCFGRQ
ncbi:Hsp70 family protein [Leucobacter chinensis]